MVTFGADTDPVDKVGVEEREGGGKAHSSLIMEPNLGLNPETPGSWPVRKPDAQSIKPPRDPAFGFSLDENDKYKNSNGRILRELMVQEGVWEIKLHSDLSSVKFLPNSEAHTHEVNRRFH